MLLLVPDTESNALVGVVGPIIQAWVVVREGFLEEGSRTVNYRRGDTLDKEDRMNFSRRSGTCRHLEPGDVPPRGTESHSL